MGGAAPQPFRPDVQRKLAAVQGPGPWKNSTPPVPPRSVQPKIDFVMLPPRPNSSWNKLSPNYYQAQLFRPVPIELYLPSSVLQQHNYNSLQVHVQQDCLLTACENDLSIHMGVEGYWQCLALCFNGYCVV